MSKEQILQAEGDDLSRMAGEVLERTHEPCLYGPYDDPPSTSIGCRHCHKTVHDVTTEQRRTFYDEYCSIPLTPANAFKWRDWASAEYGQREYADALMTIWVNDAEGGSDLDYFITSVHPKHYIKAAMLCKEQSNE